MSALTAGLVSGRSDWTAPVTVALLVAGVALLALFPLVESRRRVPMVEPALFREPLFVASVAGALFLGLSTIALMSYLPLFAQRVMGVSVLGSAVLLTAWSAVSAWVAVETRRLPAAWDGRHRLIARLRGVRRPGWSGSRSWAPRRRGRCWCPAWSWWAWAAGS